MKQNSSLALISAVFKSNQCEKRNPMQQRFDVRNRDGAVDTSFFEQLKFHYKLPETTQKICEHLFVFLTRSIGVGKGRGGRDPPN